jgi:hypothetical protein
MTFFRNQDARCAGAVMAAVVGLVALSGMAASRSAGAQTLNGRPGVEYYPSWMLDADPRVSGGGQDYRIWDDKRFDRRDEDFLEFQRKQRQDLGTGYSDRPEYKQDLQQFDEQRADRNATGSLDPAPVLERGTAAPR